MRSAIKARGELPAQPSAPGAVSRWVLALALGAGCLAGAPGCGSDGAATPEPPCHQLTRSGAAARSLVLVLSDTTRRDRVGIYGGPARTPAFDAFARENVLFQAASSQAPWTKPSMATLFTGLYPSQHGVLSHPELSREPHRRSQVLETDVLDEGAQTMAEVLRDAGLRTAAFVANPWLQPNFGFAQGFQVYDDSLAATEAPGSRVTEAALGWLRDVPTGAPYFLYLHYMDAHAPYGRLRPEDLERKAAAIAADHRSMDEFSRRVVRGMTLFEDGSPVLDGGGGETLTHLELTYDRGIENFDAAFGALLEALAERLDWEQTALVVTSDHGEALLTRGWIGHGFGLFEDEMAVPLAARLPGIPAPAQVACPVGLVDLMASLCTYLELGCPPGAGRSVLPPAKGRDLRKPRYLLAEGVKNKPEHRSIRNRHFKLLFEPRGPVVGPRSPTPFSLYALRDDPHEQNDLLDDPSPEDLRVFHQLLPALNRSLPRVLGRSPARAPIDEATRRRLEELGYLE